MYMSPMQVLCHFIQEASASMDVDFRVSPGTSAPWLPRDYWKSRLLIPACHVPTWSDSYLYHTSLVTLLQPWQTAL